MSNIADDMIDEAHSKEIDKLNITIARLQDQLATMRGLMEQIWGAAGVVVSAGGVSGVMNRHLMPQINRIKPLLATIPTSDSEQP